MLAHETNPPNNVIIPISKLLFTYFLSLRIVVLWVITSRIFIEDNQGIGVTCCLLLQFSNKIRLIILLQSPQNFFCLLRRLHCNA
jgi:hypothetical protein